MEDKKVKCRYQFCQHKNRELDKSKAITKGSGYFHEDCARTQDQIKEIVDLFVKHINPNPVFTQLQSVIKNIVFSRGLGSDYLLFGLKYYIEHNIPLNYPQGLYYVVQNKNVAAAYKQAQIKKEKQEYKIEIKEEGKSTQFTYNPVQQKSLADILQ